MIGVLLLDIKISTKNIFSMVPNCLYSHFWGLGLEKCVSYFVIFERINSLCDLLIAIIQIELKIRNFKLFLFFIFLCSPNKSATLKWPHKLYFGPVFLSHTVVILPDTEHTMRAPPSSPSPITSRRALDGFTNNYKNLHPLSMGWPYSC